MAFTWHNLELLRLNFDEPYIKIVLPVKVESGMLKTVHN
jgi:hypothetical protein